MLRIFPDRRQAYVASGRIRSRFAGRKKILTALGKCVEIGLRSGLRGKKAAICVLGSALPGTLAGTERALFPVPREDGWIILKSQVAVITGLFHEVQFPGHERSSARDARRVPVRAGGFPAAEGHLPSWTPPRPSAGSTSGLVARRCGRNRRPAHPGGAGPPRECA
jgi:hypothetical protein